ncbi:MAG: hypothetical protein AAGD34_20325 [Pseudomonadota bacterium]
MGHAADPIISLSALPPTAYSAALFLARKYVERSSIRLIKGDAVAM